MARPGLTETWNTLALLKKHGVEYVADWIHDDLPVRMNSGLYSIPYTIELNDMPLFNAPSISIQDYKQRICDAFDVLYAEELDVRAGDVHRAASVSDRKSAPHQISR